MDSAHEYVLQGASLSLFKLSSSPPKKCWSVRRFVGRPIFGLPNLIQKVRFLTINLGRRRRRLFRRQHSKAGREEGGLDISLEIKLFCPLRTARTHTYTCKLYSISPTPS